LQEKLGAVAIFATAPLLLFSRGQSGQVN